MKKKKRKKRMNIWMKTSILSGPDDRKSSWKRRPRGRVFSRFTNLANWSVVTLPIWIMRYDIIIYNNIKLQIIINSIDVTFFILNSNTVEYRFFNIMYNLSILCIFESITVKVKKYYDVKNFISLHWDAQKLIIKFGLWYRIIDDAFLNLK